MSINPGAVKYASGKKVDDEVIAEGFSSIFEMTKEEVFIAATEEQINQIISKELQKWLEWCVSGK